MSRSKIRTSGAEGLTLSSTALTVANGLTMTDGDIALASGHGVSFASTSDASGMASELIDDYEEGTWTPAVSGLTLSSVSGHYVKIGKVVHFGLRVTVPTTSATTHFKFTGIPYNPHSTNNFGGALNFADANVENVTVILTTGNDVQFYKTGSAFVTYADFSGDTVVASGSYLVA